MENEFPLDSKAGKYLKVFSWTALILAVTLHRIIDLAMIIVVWTLILLFGLQFAPQDGWSSAPAVITLHGYCDPPLAATANWLGMKWPSQSPSYLPLGLSLAVFFVWIVAGQILLSIRNPAKRMIKLNRKQNQVKTATVFPAAASAAPAPPVPEIAAQKRNSARTPIPKSEIETIPFSRGGSTMSNTEIMPKHIGRYEIIDSLGRGAMGVVYKARDPQIGRIVAIKSISAAVPSDPEFIVYKQRFMQEAKAAGQMLHPGIVTVYDLTEDKYGHPSMVMEFVEGSTLDKLMSDERLPFKRSMNLLAQAARALDYAHQRNVIHRDIKPANLLVTRSDVLKIADFGVAKLAGSSLTLTGQLLGTPAFMSPEQFTGSAVDGRSDLFSLGAILYWMCTGELPFPGESVTSIGIKVMQTEPVSARQLNPSLPPEIEHVIAHCLAKRPDKRYPTAADLAADLEALGSGRPLPSESKKPD